MVLTTLVHVPHFITAVQGAMAVYVYRSPLVNQDCDMWEPVHDYLDTRQHELVASERYEDENMMFGEGIYDEYSVATA